MSKEITQMSVRVSAPNIEDGVENFTVHFAPTQYLNAPKPEGLLVPEVQLNVYCTSPRQFTERYIVDGAVLANIDKAIAPKLLAFGTCVMASLLHVGRKAFLEQGFTTAVINGVHMLYPETYEAPDTDKIRLVGTKELDRLASELLAAGFEFDLPPAIAALRSKLQQVNSPHPALQASMEFLREDDDRKIYELRVNKKTEEESEDNIFALAQVTTRSVQPDGMEHPLTLATIETLTCGYAIEPWNSLDAAMVVAQACMVMLPLEHPLVVGFSPSVVAEYEQLAEHPMAGQPEHAAVLQGVRLMSNIVLDQNAQALAARGMQVGFKPPAWAGPGPDWAH